MGASSLATLYAQRERLQLGSTYAVVGNMHNVASGYSNDCSSSPHKTDFTRVLTWNVGGGAGTLRDRDKLRFLTNTMLQQHVHLACITEGKVTLKELKRLLRQVNMHLHFRAFGKNGDVTWLVQTAVADKVVQTLDLQETRISGLVLAGECKQRTLVLGMYGFSGSTTDSRSARLQQELWEYITPLVTAAQRKGHHVCVLGDFNVVPTADLTSSERPLQTAIGHFCSWQQALQLDNALLTACPGASLEKGFFSRSRLTKDGAQLALLDHIMASRGLTHGAGVLVMPAGAAGRTDRWGDHDAVVADLNLGFSPLPSQAKRPPIRWAHSYSPLDWEKLNTDSDVSDELDALLFWF